MVKIRKREFFVSLRYLHQSKLETLQKRIFPGRTVGQLSSDVNAHD